MRNKEIIRVALVLLTITLAFQNCADAVFDSDSASSESASENGAQHALGLHYRTLCETSSGKPGLPDGTEISGISGHASYTIGSIATVRDVSGSLVLYGTGTDPRIDSIERVSGSVILCGVSVNRASEISGSVIVVNGDVGPVTNLSGSIFKVP